MEKKLRIPCESAGKIRHKTEIESSVRPSPVGDCLTLILFSLTQASILFAPSPIYFACNPRPALLTFVVPAEMSLEVNILAKLCVHFEGLKCLFCMGRVRHGKENIIAWVCMVFFLSLYSEF